MRTPDCESVARIQLAYLRAAPGRGFSGQDVECGHGRVLLTRMLSQVRPCPRLAPDGLTERAKEPDAKWKCLPGVESGAVEGDYRVVGKLPEGLPGATRELATTGSSAAIRGRGGALLVV